MKKRLNSQNAISGNRANNTMFAF
ncbi:uncharacterized protein METZ01_LOCUS89418 [marine metagenome]|uniref:Uncharacterized protein n=1 Tax=marine metagenome TaxID=408172 RepID=A0A381V8T8_9ZZZZ